MSLERINKKSARHDQLHREFAKGDGLMEFMLYNMDSRPEFEANVFAAQILLPDDEVLEYIYAGYDAEQIARIMNTDINLVALKVATLNQQGYNFRGIEHNSSFLKQEGKTEIRFCLLLISW